MYPSHYRPSLFSFFFFNDTATTEIYTLSLHDALPILWKPSSVLITARSSQSDWRTAQSGIGRSTRRCVLDRKSTRLNSSHGYISYAVFCLKKKKKHTYSCKCETTSTSRTHT